MTIVIDTNVWISALVFGKSGSVPKQALIRAITYDVIASCEEIEAEILRILTGKFGWEVARAGSTIEALLARSVRVELRGTVQVCRDPHDDMFLECAQRAKADFIVAGDKDLLVLGSHKQTRIITPVEYLQLP